MGSVVPIERAGAGTARPGAGHKAYDGSSSPAPQRTMPMPNQRPPKHHLALAAILAWMLPVAGVCAVGDQFARVDVHQPDKVQAGRIAFVDASQDKLIEMDLTGKITWEFFIPPSLAGKGKLAGGTDVEWLPQSDHFLLAIAGTGVFEINRQGQTVWQYATTYADHDADRLDNGNTVFVNGWDADNDPVLTEVDRAGNIVLELFARDLDLDPAERHSVVVERHSNTHANAVQQLGPAEYLLSLRNFDQFVKIKNGKVVARVKNARNVHDPVPYKDGYLFAVHIAEDKSNLLYHRGPGQRQPFFKPEPGSWTPLRTVEPLRNGNILITGGREVGQLDANGQLVWSLVADHFGSGKNAQKSARYFYKAAFVYK